MIKPFSIILLICLWGWNYDGKYPPIIYPEGGYDLPQNVEDKDTTFYCYPIRNLESPLDSIRDAFYGYKFLSAFYEPNLSIKSFEKAIFRFSYQPWTSSAYVITLNEDSIIVKRGTGPII